MPDWSCSRRWGTVRCGPGSTPCIDLKMREACRDATAGAPLMLAEPNMGMMKPTARTPPPSSNIGRHPQRIFVGRSIRGSGGVSSARFIRGCRYCPRFSQQDHGTPSPSERLSRQHGVRRHKDQAALVHLAGSMSDQRGIRKGATRGQGPAHTSYTPSRVPCACTSMFLAQWRFRNPGGRCFDIAAPLSLRAMLTIFLERVCCVLTKRGERAPISRTRAPQCSRRK